MKLFTATNVSAAFAAAGAVAIVGTIAQYGRGPHGGEMGISVAIGFGWALLFAFVGFIVGLFAIWKKTGRPRRFAQAATLANVGVVVGLFATGLCGGR